MTNNSNSSPRSHLCRVHGRHPLAQSLEYAPGTRQSWLYLTLTITADFGKSAVTMSISISRQDLYDIYIYIYIYIYLLEQDNAHDRQHQKVSKVRP